MLLLRSSIRTLNRGPLAWRFSRQNNKLNAQSQLDPTKYYENRVTTLANIQKYPWDYKPSATLQEVIATCDQLAKNSNPTDTEVQKVKIWGRISNIRNQGKLSFIDIIQGTSLQVMFVGEMPAYLRRGDIIGVEGVPFITKTGQPTVKTSDIKLLAPCLHMLPARNKLKDVETRYRKRYLDLMVNSKSIEVFKKRSQVISTLRDRLVKKGYIEVETPSLAREAGGAVAKPFETYLHELDMPLFMRIAPELYLKKLLIGGLEKVFQIGKNFRNQGMDQTHNPEFTSCELYAANQTYRDMLDFTEELICDITKTVTGSDHIKITTGQQSRLINLTRPWKKVSLVPGLEEKLGVAFPKEFDSEESRIFLDSLCRQYKIECSEPRSASRLLDKLAGEFLEPLSYNQPLFIVDHPKVMSPLAKTHPNDLHTSQRFELFLNGWQIVNSYTELNDPVQQLKNCPEDSEYVQALEHGLVPCAGWGIGIDRLVMLLTDSPSIQEAILFPLMKPLPNPTKTP